MSGDGFSRGRCLVLGLAEDYLCCCTWIYPKEMDSLLIAQCALSSWCWYPILISLLYPSHRFTSGTSFSRGWLQNLLNCCPSSFSTCWRDLSKWQICSWHFIAYTFFRCLQGRACPLNKQDPHNPSLTLLLTHTSPQRSRSPAAPRRTFLHIVTIQLSWQPTAQSCLH